LAETGSGSSMCLIPISLGWNWWSSNRCRSHAVSILQGLILPS